MKSEIKTLKEEVKSHKKEPADKIHYILPLEKELERCKKDDSNQYFEENLAQRLKIDELENGIDNLKEPLKSNKTKQFDKNDSFEKELEIRKKELNKEKENLANILKVKI